MNLNSHDGLSAFAPGVQPQIAALLQAGTADATLEVSPLPLPDPATRRPAHQATRFSLSFEYCLGTVRWQVVMQRCAAAWVPDFVFTESTFQPLVPGPGGGSNAKQLAAALAAAGGDGQLLASVVALLIDSYAAHHANRVAAIAATDSRLQFELDTTDAEGRQVMLQKTAGAAAAKVVVVVPVPGIHLAALLAPPQPDQPPLPTAEGPQPSRPDQWTKGGAGTPSPPPGAVPPPQPRPELSPQAAAHAAALARKIRLKVTYLVGGGAGGSSWASVAGGSTAPQVSLSLPTTLTALLGSGVSLPNWTSNMCLMEFLPNSTDTVQAAVDAAVVGRSRRAALLVAVTGLAGGPVHADTSGWWAGSWRVEVQGVVCLLHLKLTAEYPDALPRLTLQADGKDDQEARPIVTYTDYKWSPRWSATEAAQRIFTHLEDTAPNWKGHLQGSPGISV